MYIYIYIYVTNAASHTTREYNGRRQQNGWCVFIFMNVLKFIFVCTTGSSWRATAERVVRNSI